MTPLQVTPTSFFMSLASPPSSRIADIHKSDLVTAGNTQAILSLVGSEGMLNVPIFVAFVELSSGKSTIGPFLICLLFIKGTSHIAQFPVIPISRMA